MKIWKWPIRIACQQIVMMPVGSKILTVQMQGLQPQVWALVFETQDAPEVPRVISVYGTGNPILRPPGEYIATFQTSGGDFVWHAFETI